MRPADRFIKRVAPALGWTIGKVRSLTAKLQPNDDWVESWKRVGAVALDPIFSPLGRPLIFECHGEDYFCTADATGNEIEIALFLRYQRNLTSTRKYRLDEGERDWADGSWVFDPEDTDWQHHVYIFENGDGTTDVYGHLETSAEQNPLGHVLGEQDHGDPQWDARNMFKEFDITWTKS